MRVISEARAMERAIDRLKVRGGKVGFVPTMGYLHDGHLSLVRKARQLIGDTGTVVVSIYVNPTQFAPAEDLSRYPRDLKRDLKLCKNAGVDLVFTPANEEMYPAGNSGYSTYVVEEQLSKHLEGSARPTHFRGVTTIVTKLFNIVRPHVAVFGEKDFQQAAIIRRMIRDLNFPIKMVVAPTFREADGLAMSSRNVYLSPEERRQATVLWQIIGKARAAAKSGPIPVRAFTQELLKFVKQFPAARVDYISFFDEKTLLPLEEAPKGARLALAVFLGKTRLIDNALL